MIPLSSDLENGRTADTVECRTICGYTRNSERHDRILVLHLVVLCRGGSAEGIETRPLFKPDFYRVWPGQHRQLSSMRTAVSSRRCGRGEHERGRVLDLQGEMRGQHGRRLWLQDVFACPLSRRTCRRLSPSVADCRAYAVHDALRVGSRRAWREVHKQSDLSAECRRSHGADAEVSMGHCCSASAVPVQCHCSGLERRVAERPSPSDS
jgi:hypothetical protein